MIDKYYIGVDVGGTSVKAIITDHLFHILHKKITPTEAIKGHEYVLSKIIKLIEDLIMIANVDISHISGIGIGLPGLVDIKNGISIELPNLGWKNIQTSEPFETYFNVPVFIDNDGNINAFGEKYFGAGKGINDLILLTLGTGVGGGIFVAGELLRGVNNLAAEVGHIIIQKHGEKCSCGGRGHFESYCSAKSMIRKAKELAMNNKQCILWELTNGNLDNLTAQMLDIGFDRNDKVCMDIIYETAQYLSLGLAGLINIFNPEVIIIGGGVSGSGERLLNPARKLISVHLLNVEAQSCRIELAQLGSEAGMLGACALVAKKIGAL